MTCTKSKKTQRGKNSGKAMRKTKGKRATRHSKPHHTLFLNAWAFTIKKTRCARKGRRGGNCGKLHQGTEGGGDKRRKGNLYVNWARRGPGFWGLRKEKKGSRLNRKNTVKKLLAGGAQQTYTPFKKERATASS